MKKSHRFCKKCLVHIVRLAAKPKEQCGHCDPQHKTRSKQYHADLREIKAAK